MNVRHALVAATATASLALSAAPAQAQEIIDCGPTFLLGPVECQIEQTQQTLADSPPVECRVTFLVGPVACRVEREWRSAFDPDNT